MNAIEKAGSTSLAEVRPLNMQHLFETAIASPGGAESLAKLQEIYYRQQDRDAALEFAEALAKFQDECPPITRSSVAKFGTRSGGEVGYKFANFEQIIETTRPHLHANGFSVSFDMDVANGMVTAACTLRHVNGHSISAKATIPWASNNPGMSDQQKFGSANTFAKRTALTSVLGLSLTDPEEEGADPTPITAEQVNIIDDLVTRSGADFGRFIKWATGKDDGKYSDILATRFEECKADLLKKLAIKQAKEAGK